MKLPELYGLTNYVNMLDKTDLVQTKKQIKEMYLQNLLADKLHRESLIKPKVDAVTQAYLEDRLTEYLDELQVMPGFEGVKDLFRPKYKERSSKANSKRHPSNEDTKSKLKKSVYQASKKLSLTEDGLHSMARKSSFV